MNKHYVHTRNTEGFCFESNINEHKLHTDAGIADGGTNSGPGPKRLMLASLAGCTGIDIVSILQKMRVEYSDLSIDTEATVAEDHPKVYTHVKIIYKIKVAAEDQPKMEKAVTLSEEKYCGVMAMFRSFAKLEREIVYL